MCGIAGYIGAEPIDLEPAIARLLHRGPDDRGIWQGKLGGRFAGLAHTRLAVIDLSAAGHQPMEAPGGLRITFNGEIYNYRELREELRALGHQFRTDTDTEVILEGYRRFGDGIVDRLRGMYAFALLDEKRERALLVRDRLGMKPLYYATTSKGLVFASEIGALLPLLGEYPDLDLCAVRDYLTYLYVPAPRSIFQGISQLLPGHLLIATASGSQVGRYWQLPAVEQQRPRREVVAALRTLLIETVDSHLVSDVPLGAFLSGGLDSTTLVALMARRGSGSVKTFCMTFDPEAGLYDERQYAQAVARAYGTEHTEIPVHPDLVNLLPESVEHFGEPFGNPTALLVYLLSRETRRHVTVALAGDGGDELFLGYPRYQGAALSRAYRHLPAAAREILAERIAPQIPESTRGFHTLRRLREFLIGSELPEDDMYAQWVTYFTAHEQRTLLAPEVRRATAGYDPLTLLTQAIAADHPRDLLDRCQALDLATFLPGNLLTYSDRMSMAHGLEVRTPFCDHRLVEFMARIPANQKMPGLRTKTLLREAVADLLPPAVKRRKKLGFNPPVGIWLKGPLRPILEETLSAKRVGSEGIFVPEAIERLKTEHQSGQRDRSLHLYALLNFQIWAQTFRKRHTMAASRSPEIASYRT